MKNLLIVLFLAAPFWGKAQWQSKGRDTAALTDAQKREIELAVLQLADTLSQDEKDDIEMRGSKMERDYQEGLIWSSEHRRLVALVGAKVDWFNETSLWLQENGNPYLDSKTSANGAREVWTFWGGKSRRKFSATIDLNPKTRRIKKVVIKGPADELIHMFISYWDRHISMNDLRRGGYVYQDLNRDRISFSWKDADPVITISQTTNAFMNIFPKNP